MGGARGRRQCGGVPCLRRSPLRHGDSGRRRCRSDAEDDMTGRLADKVALITGAARGIGRSQALRFAQEGADVIALDLCGPVETVSVPACTPEDLDETARLVRAAGGRIVTSIVDVRDEDQLRSATDDGVASFGRLDIVCATAGITSRGLATELSEAAWQTMLDVNLSGVWRT